jgi:hypothetical protein
VYFFEVPLWKRGIQGDFLILCEIIPAPRPLKGRDKGTFADEEVFISFCTVDITDGSIRHDE